MIGGVEPGTLLLYCGAMAMMAISPGPANIFAIATGMGRGWKAGLVGVSGMLCAGLTWFVAAALGLAALVKAFPLAFELLAIGGALYVGWLGAKAVWSGLRGDGEAIEIKGGAASMASAFRDGFAVQIANPKALLFFTAVLPPFVEVARPILPQLTVFATITTTMDAIAMGAYALMGGALTARLASNRFRRGFSLAVGLLLLTTAALIVLRQVHVF